MSLCSTARFARATVLSIVAGVSGLAAHQDCQAAQPKAEFENLVHESDLIFVGTVLSRVSHLNEGGRAIVTDVTFRVNEVIHSGARGRAVGETIVLTYLGGSIEGLTMNVSGSPKFTEGAEYVLFALNDGQNYVHPLIGGNQGLFQVVRDTVTGEAYPVAPGRRAVAEIEGGVMRLTPTVSGIKSGRAELDAAVLPQNETPHAALPGDGAVAHRFESEAVMSLDAFREAIRGQAGRAPAADWGFDRDAEASAEFRGLTPKNVTNAGDVLERLATVGQIHRTEGEPPTPVKEDRRDLAEMRESGVRTLDPKGLNEYPENEEAIEDLDPTRAALCYCGFYDIFLTMEQVPSGWQSYQPNNDCMWLFNNIMDIYRTTADDGSYGGLNDENEFAGFLTNAQVNSEYGFMWGTSIALTVTWSLCDCCEVIEADIMFNAGRTWVYSFDAAFNNGSVLNYLPTAIHELGHSWGSQSGTCVEDYSYNRPTIMHAYYSNVVEDGWGLHGWDVTAMREIYDAQTGVRTWTDVGVESYVASGSLVNADTDGVTVFRPGEPITIRNISTENMSNTAQSDVRLRFFLSTNDTISTADTQMGGYWFYGTINPGGSLSGNFSTNVPNVPPGTYYVGVIVTRGGASYLMDDFTSNNSTYLPQTIQVIPPLPGNDESENAYDVGTGNHAIDTTGATTDGLANLSCAGGSAFNDVWYRFTPLCTGRLTASTCNSANFDTVVAIYLDSNNPPGAASLRSCNDDTPGCGTTSVTSAFIFEGLSYLIRVGGYSTTAVGTGVLSLTFDPDLDHDECANPLIAGIGRRSFSTVCATTDGLSHSTCQFNGQTYNDIWFYHDAACTGNLTVSTCNDADYDTDIAVYSTRFATCPPTDISLLGCADDTPGCAGFTSTVTVPVTEGERYLIRVGGFNAGDAGQGGITLSIECAPPQCLGDANRDGVVNFADITSVLANWLATYPDSGEGDADYDGTVNFADITSVLTNWGETCP